MKHHSLEDSPDIQIDPELLSLLKAFWEADDGSYEELARLEDLAKWLRPIIRGFVDSESKGAMPEDLRQEIAEEALGKLLFEIWECKKDRRRKPIKNLLAYGRTIVRNLLRDAQRNQNPVFRKFSDALKYELDKDSRFARWKEGKTGKTIFGWRQQVDQPVPATPPEQLKKLMDDPRAAESEIFSSHDVQHLSEAELVTGILNWIGHPLEFTILARIVFKLQGYEEIEWVTEMGVDEPGSILETLDVGTLSPEEEMAEKEFVRLVWNEVVMMPVEERRAFMLSTEDIGWHRAVAYNNICVTLELEDEHFASAWVILKIKEQLQKFSDKVAKLAEMWKKVPLSLEKIAKIFSVTKGDVSAARDQAFRKIGLRLQNIQ